MRFLPVAAFTGALLLSSGLAVGAPVLARADSPAPVAASGESPPPEAEITINVVTVNGSGCPRGTAAVAVSEDNTAFTVTYSDYLAVVGPDSDPTDFRKNCQLNLQVHVPQGFTYAIARADYRGFAHLEPGASALQQASYYFQGQPETVVKDHSFDGPHNDNWQVMDETETGQLVYAPCGEERYFNINTELRVDAGDSDPSTTSFISMDSTDGSIDTTYHFAWKKCDA